jgi:hypothetical protein
MAAPQNIVGIVYDYDQTLSPTYMQDEVLFPKFGINPAEFWKRCKTLVEEQGYESELAYLKAIIDYLEMDGPSNADLTELGKGLKFFPGLPGMFDELEDLLHASGEMPINVVMIPEYAGRHWWDRILHNGNGKRLRDTLLGRRVSRVHVVGGGVKNRLLCQATADRAGVPVVSFNLEGTAVGNLASQLISLGAVKDLKTFRRHLGATLEQRTYLQRR